MAEPIAYCPTCMGPLVRKPKMFHWRGQDFHGLVCEPCKALWSDRSDNFFEAVAKSRGCGVIDDSPRKTSE